MEIVVNGIKIHYEVLGEGKPIILLNPNSVNTGFMNKIARKLAEEYMVYKVDRRGCGKSERKCSMTYEETAKDIYELICALKLDKPYVLGSSGGATVAMHLAMSYPDSISKLVLCSGMTRNIDIKYPKYFEIICKLPWYPGKANTDKFVKMNNKMRTLTKEDLEKIVVPTLVVNGGKKDIVPIDEAEFIADCIKVSKLLILNEETHSSYVLNVDVWLEELKDFLNR